MADGNNNANQQTRRGCLYTILLLALTGIAVNECKRSRLRFEYDKQRYEQHQMQSLPAPDTTATSKVYVYKFNMRIH